MALLEQIGRQRGCLRSGQHIDFDKAAKLLLTELRSGMLGAISLETPAMVADELVELEVIRVAKAAKKVARQRGRKPQDATSVIREAHD